MADNNFTSYTPRISTIDSLLLDREFKQLIKGQILKIFDKLKISHWCHIYSAEFEFIFSSLLWKITTGTYGWTIGQRLLGLKYEENSWKLKLFYLVDTLLVYVFRRVATSIGTIQRLDVTKVINRIESIGTLAESINFLLFLVDNKYPSIAHRLCKLRMIPAAKRVPYTPGDSYQIRELLWHQFSEFLMVIIPFFQLYIVRKYWIEIKKYLGMVPRRNVVRVVTENPSASSANIVSKCCYCNQDAVIPQYVAKCSFCYFCLKANNLDDNTYVCSLSGHE